MTAVDYAYSYTVKIGANRDQLPPPRGWEVVSMGWHLTKIRYVNGKNIDFIYNKDAFTVAGNFILDLGSTKTERPGLPTNSDPNPLPLRATCSNLNLLNNFTILWNAYLQEIQTPYEIIKFTKEELSGYLNYPQSYDNVGKVSITNRKWFKLSKIQTFKNPISNTSQKPLVTRNK